MPQLAYLPVQSRGWVWSHEVWQWQSQNEGWLFAATWLLFGPPVMVWAQSRNTNKSSPVALPEAAADVLLNLDLASLADEARTNCKHSCAVPPSQGGTGNGYDPDTVRFASGRQGLAHWLIDCAKGFDLAGMVVVGFAAPSLRKMPCQNAPRSCVFDFPSPEVYGWTLTLSSALLCRHGNRIV